MKAKGIGGAERHLLLLLPALRSSGVDLDFILLEDVRWPSLRHFLQLEDQGIHVHRLRFSSFRSSAALVQLMSHLRRQAYTIVHTHLPHADAIATIGARLAGAPTVLSTKHGYDDYSSPSNLYRLNGYLSRWVKSVITISRALQVSCHRFEGIPLHKMTTIYYGLPPPERISPRDRFESRSLMGLEAEHWVVGAAGRLVPVKGFDHLIRAFAVVSRTHPQARLVLAGAGPLKAQLSSLARDLGISSRVLMLGFREDLRRFYAALDVFCVSSLGEGFGLATLEAMSHGLPIVATRTGATPEIVLDGVTGLLVEPAQPDDLAESMLALAADPVAAQALGQAARKRQLESFSLDRAALETLQLYRHVSGAG